MVSAHVGIGNTLMRRSTAYAAHVKLNKKQKKKSELLEKARARITYSDDVGILVRVGSEQSEIKLDTGQTRIIMNKHLEAIS